MVSQPRRYRDPRGGPPRKGYDATIIPLLCEVWLKARDARALTSNQLPVAKRADILTRALAKTGIIARVKGDRYKKAPLEREWRFFACSIERKPS